MYIAEQNTGKHDRDRSRALDRAYIKKMQNKQLTTISEVFRVGLYNTPVWSPIEKSNEPTAIIYAAMQNGTMHYSQHVENALRVGYAY